MPTFFAETLIMKIAFLGLGKMGAAMAQHLLTAGHELTVWNRDPSKTAHLASQGAAFASTPAEAAEGKQVILTMLFDDAANEAVLLGEDGALKTLAPGALHIACSTISVALSKKLAAAHAEKGQQYVAAPVFGRPNVAADGKLWIVAAGAEDGVQKARPLLEAFSRGISIAGAEPSQANAVKLAGNFLITMMIQSLSEAFVFAKASGIDPATLLETVNSALFQSPFYAAYGKVMLDPPVTPGATIALGKKDLTLFLEAAEFGGVQPTLAHRMANRFDEVIANGMADADWAAGLLQAESAAAQKGRK
jgi:3-hydroxyisobutyrate dehydrogenase-like beta-hydroxyacid dehydrogenase